MPAQLNHTIVHARDAELSAAFLAEMLDVKPPTRFGHFHVVATDNDVSLDFMDSDDIQPQHYTFLVSEDQFVETFDRIRDRGLEYWADPMRSRPGAINNHDGGRGVYFPDPNGHLLEIITRNYGGGA